MRRVLLPGVVMAVLAAAWLGGAGPRFLPDDPLAVEPETQDASKAAPRDIDLIWDLAENLFTRPGDPAPDVRAGNVNTIDEVPDSNWFTNRIFARPVSIDEAVRGPLEGMVRPPARGRSPHRRAPGSPRASASATAPASSGSCRSTRSAFESRPPARSPWPTSSSGRSATTRSRTT